MPSLSFRIEFIFAPLDGRVIGLKGEKRPRGSALSTINRGFRFVFRCDNHVFVRYDVSGITHKRPIGTDKIVRKNMFLHIKQYTRAPQKPKNNNCFIKHLNKSMMFIWIFMSALSPPLLLKNVLYAPSVILLFIKDAPRFKYFSLVNGKNATPLIRLWLKRSIIVTYVILNCSHTSPQLHTS